MMCPEIKLLFRLKSSSPDKTQFQTDILLTFSRSPNMWNKATEASPDSLFERVTSFCCRAEPRGELPCSSAVLSSTNVKVLIAIKRGKNEVALRKCTRTLWVGSSPETTHITPFQLKVDKSQQTPAKPIFSHVGGWC